MCARSGPSMSAQSDEPLNHIPYPLLSLSASQDPAPRNPATTLRDFGCGPTSNQTHNESSHADNPITPTQQICRHRPSCLSFCIKAMLCWPQLGCKRIPTEAHSAIRSLLPLTHLRLGPLRVLISPQHHLACKLHREITQPLNKMLAQQKEISN